MKALFFIILILGGILLAMGTWQMYVGTDKTRGKVAIIIGGVDLFLAAILRAVM